MTGYFVEGVLLPADLAPELNRLVGDSLASRAVSGRLRDWLRTLDSTARVKTQGVRAAPTGDPFAGWYGVEEAASLLDVSARQVRRMCESGRLVAEKVADRVWKISPRSVERMCKPEPAPMSRVEMWGAIGALLDEQPAA